MKTFIKIFTFSFTVQSIGFLGTFLLDKMTESKNSSSVVAILPAVIGIIISMVISFVLSIKWCETLKAKIITVIFMPTNYSFVVIVILFIKFITAIIDILHNFPNNFG